MEVSELKRRAGLGPYSKRLQLKKVSGEYKALCPWHADHSPSLSVFEKDGGYCFKCFACTSRGADAKGDVIKFVQQFDKLTFKGALEKLKSECGITDSEIAGFAAFKYDPKAATAELDKAAEFLKARGIDLKLARECGVGYCNYPGIGPAVSLPFTSDVFKFRAVTPEDKDRKFRHLKDRPSAELFFGLDTFDGDDFLFTPEVWVTESELDSLTLRSHGFCAVSVSSATTCIDSNGKLKIKKEDLDKLNEADRIFLVFDQDEAGQKCADAFEKALPRYKTFRVTWKYDGKGSTDAKDIGEIYCQTLDKFHERINELKRETISRPPAWRALFKSRDQMEQGDIRFLIKDFLPEGVCMLGALSGSGKTWFALSMAKALTTGKKFLGRFEVAESVNILYLIPESGERAFWGRLDKMGISERFLCRTMKDGVPLKLDDPLLMAAIRDLKPVVFLDTAIRFTGGEENSASDNAKGLATGIFRLLQAGAQAVVGLHHQAKAAADKFPTLENTLRGSGDIGAMCDSVYNLQCVNSDTRELRITCVKPRDFEPVPAFNIQGRPFIDDTGDFGMLLEPGLPKGQAEVQNMIQAIKANPKATYRELEQKTGIPISRLSRMTAKTGWQKNGDTWFHESTNVQEELI